MDYETARGLLDGIQRTVDDLTPMEDDAIDWYRAEVKRLRADYAKLHDAFWMLRGATQPPHDTDELGKWGEAMAIVNALPAPPTKEE